MSTSNTRSLSPPLPWQVLNLVSPYLDPQTLSIASCVSKPWLTIMSSDHIWKPLCFTHYPSFSHLRRSHPTISYRNLYTLAHLSSKYRLRRPSPPVISLKDLIFSINIFTGAFPTLTLTKSVEELCYNGTFRFDIDVYDNDQSSNMVEACDESREMRVMWTVVLKGWKGVFLMMDCKGKGRFIPGGERWFSEELPATACCVSSSALGTSGVVAELGLGIYGDEGKEMRVRKVSVGMLNVTCWRYLSVEDALRYLQHFLLCF